MIMRVINGEEIYFDCRPSCISDNRQFQYCEQAYDKYIKGDMERMIITEYNGKKVVILLR